MVLGELGNKISDAWRKFNATRQVDETVLNDMLKEMTNALVNADVDVQLTKKFEESVREKVNLGALAPGLNKRKVIQQVVLDELVQLVDPGKKPFKPRKGQCNVIMFVGLQGAGKTTTITKFGYHYRRKGWKVGLVCADTFRAGAFAQLKQNATKAKLAFYGSHTETDPVKAAKEGVDEFKSQKYEIILVDTSGRHKQEEGLFQEMQQIAELVQPNDVVFVLDASIGQAARPQAEAFKAAVPVGSVVITKIDGHARGGGALSAVAATGSPIVFLGTGEHFDDLDPFNAEAFIKRMLGMGDIEGLSAKMKDSGLEEKGKALLERLQTGSFQLRDMREQFEGVMSLGSIQKVMEMMPGASGLANMMQGQSEVEATKRMKRMLTIFDSLTADELGNADLFVEKMNKDGSVQLSTSRIKRISYGAGVQPQEVIALLQQHRMMAGMIGKMQTLDASNATQRHNARDPRAQAAQLQQSAGQLSQFLPPDVLKSMGGMSGFQDMIKAMGGAGEGGLLQSMLGMPGGAAAAAAMGRGRGRGRGK